MKTVELLKISMSMLKVMSQNDIFIDDWKYVEYYEHFLEMRRKKVKYKAAIEDLSKEAGVGTRTLERAFKRLEKNVK